MDLEEDKLGPDEEVEAEEAEPETVPPPGQPDSDFMAGAMLANGIVFVWMQALSVFRGYTSQLPPWVLVNFSYVIYILGGYVASRQVTKRTKREHLKAGLKTAGYSTVMALLIISSLDSGLDIGFAAVLGICFFAGSVLGSYMETKARLSGLGREASS